MLDSAVDKIKYSCYLVIIIFLLKFHPQLQFSHYLMVLPFTPQLGIWKHSALGQFAFTSFLAA